MNPPITASPLTSTQQPTKRRTLQLCGNTAIISVIVSCQGPKFQPPNRRISVSRDAACPLTACAGPAAIQFAYVHQSTSSLALQSAVYSTAHLGGAKHLSPTSSHPHLALTHPSRTITNNYHNRCAHSTCHLFNFQYITHYIVLEKKRRKYHIDKKALHSTSHVSITSRQG